MRKLSFRSFAMSTAAAIAGMCFVASPGPQAASSLDKPVSSDGSTGVVMDAAATMEGVPSNSGTDVEIAPAPGSAAEFARLLSLAPVSARFGKESIIGADTRFLINPTTTFPARAVVLITFSAGRCTGWMFGKNTVITAGHCVNRGAGGGFYPVASYQIFPGRNGPSSPFGSCTAKSLHSVVGWTGSGNEQFDYGAIKLNCTVGNTTGWFGAWWQSASLTGLFTRVSGYPGDKPLTQWQSTGNVTVTTTNQIFYQNDTVGGMSGGPVWQNRGIGSPFCVGQCAFGIHGYGLHGVPPHSNNNHAKRITQPTFNNLIFWRNLP